MITKTYNIPGRQLQYDIENTIRVFDKYRMDKKQPDEGVIRVWESLTRYDYFIAVTSDSSCELRIQASIPGKTIGDLEESQLIDGFLFDINKVVNKEILITPEVANKDIYKSVDTAQSILQFLMLLVGIAAALYGAKVLLNF